MSDAPKIRVLVVDDSAFARKVVRQVLERAGDIEVIDIARDGLEALEKIAVLAPDVITLDLMMPGLDGLAVLEALPAVGAPRVVVVSSSRADSELGAAALAAGAIDLVEKPTTQATERLYEMAEELLDRVRIAARAKASYSRRPVVPTPVPAATLSSRLELVMIGTSTGGPQALTRVLAGIPAAFPVPIAVVVHMPPGYTAALAARLDALCELTVVEAHDGLVLTRGLIALAPAGAHLCFERGEIGLRVRLDHRRIAGELHQPSVDAMFRSAAVVVGKRALGVVLTGMGEDGTSGARALVGAGGTVLAEHESSCIVYGMPRAVVEAGLASETCSLDAMAALIVARAL
jgi:two-component system, chemotaxis family, protein-glutamate methylesterase/glutaminase